MTQVQWTKKDGRLGQYRAVQPLPPLHGFELLPTVLLNDIRKKLFLWSQTYPAYYVPSSTPCIPTPDWSLCDEKNAQNFIKWWNATNPMPKGPNQGVVAIGITLDGKQYTNDLFVTALNWWASHLQPGLGPQRAVQPNFPFDRVLRGVQWLGAAPGQLGMTPAEWQFWNTSGRWWITVQDQSMAFPLPSWGDSNPPPNTYYHEIFPTHGIWDPPGAFTLTALRWVGIQRLKTLHQEWSKKVGKPIKVCALEVGDPAAKNAKYWCFDGNTVSQITETNTQINTTCPPGYVKIVHDDGSFGCVAPYVPGPADFSGQTKTFSTTTPRGYRQPVTTVAPSFPYAPPTLYRRVAGVEWLGRVHSTLGATETEMITIKTLLSAWSQGEGSQTTPFPDYGTKPQDFIPPFTKLRDGATLEAFSVWWNSGGKPPHLTTGVAGEGGTVAAPPDAAHLQALQNWAVSKGINPNPAPSTDPLVCAQNCQNKYGLDPVNLAQCLLQCGPGLPVPPPAPFPLPSPSPLPAPPTTPPPVTPPATPPPSGSTTPSSTSSALPWLIGGAAVLGLGALFLSSKTKLLENPPHPKSGYAYAYRGQNWHQVKDDSWDIVMLTPSNAKFMYVGKRRVDGSEVNVWKSGKRYVAQTTVMTGR